MPIEPILPKPDTPRPDLLPPGHPLAQPEGDPTLPIEPEMQPVPPEETPEPILGG